MDVFGVLIKTISLGLIITYPVCVVYSYGRLNHKWNKSIEDRGQWYKNRNLAILTSILMSWVTAVYLFGDDYCNGLRDNKYRDFRLWLEPKDPLFIQEVSEKPGKDIWSGYNGIPQTLERRFKKL